MNLTSEKEILILRRGLQVWREQHVYASCYRRLLLDALSLPLCPVVLSALQGSFKGL